VKTKPTIAVSLLAWAGLTSVQAQPAGLQQFQNIQLTPQPITLTNLTVGAAAPELYRGENMDVGPQRILRLNQRHHYFNVLLDSQVFYTDNANFVQDPAMIGSTVFVNTLQAAFIPPELKLGDGRIATSIGFASQWYNYENNRMSGFDFDAQTFFAAGKYTVGKWQFGVSANYTRLVNQSDYNETYNEVLPALTLQRVFPLRDDMLIALGNQVDYHFSDVPTTFGSRSDINDRFDDIASVTFSWQITPRFIFQPYYRFQYSHYEYDTIGTSDRNDYLQTVGVVLVYSFNQTASVRAFFSYNRKQSNDPITPQYLEFGGGLGASLNFKF
jgi:hypothetical protein